MARQPEERSQKVNGLQGWDGGEEANIPSVTELLDVTVLFCKLFLLLLLLYSMQPITTSAKVKSVRMKDLYIGNFTFWVCN